MAKKKIKTRYKSQSVVRKRSEKYYPSEGLKNELNDYALQTGEYKSELAIRLLRSFFAAKRKEGHYPDVIELLPQSSPGPQRKEER